MVPESRDALEIGGVLFVCHDEHGRLLRYSHDLMTEKPSGRVM